MFKMFRKFLPMILALIMVFATFANVSGAAEAPGAAEASISYQANDNYTYIVSVKTGMAVQVSGGNTAAVTADAEITEGLGNNLADKALFQMRKDSANALHVSFSSKGNAWRMLKSENVAGEDIIDTNNALKTAVSGWEAFYLVDQGNGSVAIKDGRLGKYLTVAADNRLMVTMSTVSGAAEQFLFLP